MSKTLEELQAELDAEMASKARPTPRPQSATPPPTKPPKNRGSSSGDDDKPRPKKTRGLLDFVLMCALGYGVYAMTPIGAMGEGAVRYAFGQKDAPSFFATFRGRETDVQVKAPDIKTGLLASKTVPQSVATAANGNGVDAELLVTLLSTNGQCDSSGCTIKKPRYFDMVIDQEFGDTITVGQLAKGLSKAAHNLGLGAKGVGGELAVEALYVGPIPTRLALEQAKATGIPNAEDVEAHAEFFAPSIRRGQLQSALAVLALHRLRTLAWPATGKWRISSPFGYRTHPVLGTKKFHNGTDLAVPTGTPLMAVQRGVVSRARRDSICGNYVKLNYGFGIESTYCHMSQLDVKKGARVRRKQEVGKSGSTGRVTGPHLHYILRVNGDPVDAEMYGASPTRKKAADGEDPLGKMEAVAAAEANTEKKPVKKKSKKRPKKKPKAKPAKTPKKATNTPAPVDAGASPSASDEDPASDDDRPEPTPAMPVPEGEEGVNIEDVHATPSAPAPDSKPSTPSDTAAGDAKVPGDANAPGSDQPAGDAKATGGAKAPGNAKAAGDAKTPSVNTPAADEKAPKASAKGAKGSTATSPNVPKAKPSPSETSP